VEALKTLLLAEVQNRPGVLILEDVHWIDTASEEMLATLIEAMGASPLLLVLVYRPEYPYAWTDAASHTQITLTRLPRVSSTAMVRDMLAKPYAARVRLERLTPAQSQAMVQDLVGTTALPAEVTQFITTRTDGNPLFVEELTRALVESGALVQVREPEGYRLRAALTALNLPATVQGVLLARLDRLPTNLKTVLQAASVMGRVFSYAVLARVVAPETDLDQVLLHLEELEFLYPLSPTPQREFSFKHVLTQESVYQTLLRPQREEYHARIAQAVETLSAERLEEVYEVLAHHYVRSSNRDKALEYLALANQKATKVNAMTEAKQYFASAMVLLDTLPDTEGYQRQRLELLVFQLAPMVLLMQMQEYYDLLRSYEAMAVGLGNAGLLGALYARMGFCEWWLGRLEQAIGTLTKAIDLCEAAGNAEDAGQAYLILQWSYLYIGGYDRVLALKARAIQALEQHMNPRYYGWSFAATSWALTCLGRWEEAVAEGCRALRIGEDYADGSMISFAAGILLNAWCEIV
jgi:predicted ATPase